MTFKSLMTTHTRKLKLRCPDSLEHKKDIPQIKPETPEAECYMSTCINRNNATQIFVNESKNAGLKIHISN